MQLVFAQVSHDDAPETCKEERVTKKLLFQSGPKQDSQIQLAMRTHGKRSSYRHR